jgi:hypothetical protein
MAASGVGEIGTEIAVDVVVSVEETVFVDAQEDITKETSKTMMIDFVFIYPFAKQEAAWGAWTCHRNGMPRKPETRSNNAMRTPVGCTM